MSCRIVSFLVRFCAGLWRDWRRAAIKRNLTIQKKIHEKPTEISVGVWRGMIVLFDVFLDNSPSLARQNLWEDNKITSFMFQNKIPKLYQIVMFAVQCSENLTKLTSRAPKDYREPIQSCFEMLQFPSSIFPPFFLFHIYKRCSCSI